MKISDYPAEMIVSVTSLNEYVKNRLKEDDNLRYVLVRGEISNLKVQHGVGHMYFTLKDDQSMVNATFFASYNKSLDFTPDNGMEVVCLASVDLYVNRGSYQINVYQMEQVGAGKALMELEALKQKLASEGLFNPERKRKINIYPSKIGVISAKGSAAIKDITTNIYRRYKPVEIYFFPCQVQGEKAPKDILRAFNLSQTYDLDTLIISRGGGASEDLSAFNDEQVVRAIASSNCPVIAAIGHEVDTTLVELAADLRVSTPTGAAEAATADSQEIEQHIFEQTERMKEILSGSVEELKSNLAYYKEKMNNYLLHSLELVKERLSSRKALIKSLNPYEVLNRGYSLTYNSDGKIIKSINDIDKDQEIKTLVSDGSIISKVKETKEK
ncbi:MAG: exodeoxyribonuclease VII large subunit [Coprobacillus sp.]|nr:exodeoxyribonuclease VII large subunit [Coprobacillus sp.]